MKASISKICSKCKKGIQCRVGEIDACACSQVKLRKECIEFLKKTKYDCLCNDCLESLNLLIEKAGSAPEKMTENIHYYQEDGLLVFTELNHIQRGYCCESNCKHCAYGFNLQ